MQSGKGGDAMMSIVTAFGQGKFPKEIMYNPGTPGYHATWLGIVRPPRTPTSPASSQPSSATSGPRWWPATTCIAT
jgi:hypothetical protein